MKPRENLIMKALAFMAAAAVSAAAVMMLWYQTVNFNFLWGGDSPGSCIEIRRLLYLEENSICQMLDLRGMVKAGAELSDYRKTLLKGLENAYSTQNTNLRWQLLDNSGKKLLANTEDDDARYHSGRWIYNYYGGANWGEEDHYLPLYLWVDESFPVNDQFKAAAVNLSNLRANREAFLAGNVFLAVLGLALTVFLCAGAGHKRGVEGISLNGFHRLPGDVVLFAVITGVSLIWVAAWDLLIVDYPFYSFPLALQLTLGALLVAGAVMLALAELMTFAARCKAHTLLRNTLLWRLCGWVWRLVLLLWGAVCAVFDTTGRAIQAVPLVWKAVMGCMAYVLFTVWATFRFPYGDSGTLLLWMAVTALASLYLCTWAYQWKKIRQATQEIIGGNPDCRIDTRRMLPDLRGHADELNNLGHTISAAVEDRMKSEHFKAELITNVSHDLKTPLTSIINYVDLLKKEQIDNPRVLEYIEVLDRKSQRLKKLTEDLVEASKASTGSLTVSWERLDFRQLADQALAECGDRLGAQGLTVVRTLPEGPVWVEADGRHLWRVLDNLLTNCAKYALPGTRVYVDLRESGGRAALSVKNISRDPLDIPAERLMERFVRGDESRNALGSGLGLSIAQSLTELQHGQFSISIDGDLFKAMVSLPLAGEDGDGSPILRL